MSKRKDKPTSEANYNKLIALMKLQRTGNCDLAAIGKEIRRLGACFNVEQSVSGTRLYKGGAK